MFQTKELEKPENSVGGAASNNNSTVVPDSSGEDDSDDEEDNKETHDEVDLFVIKSNEIIKTNPILQPKFYGDGDKIEDK